MAQFLLSDLCIWIGIWQIPGGFSYLYTVLVCTIWLPLAQFSIKTQITEERVVLFAECTSAETICNMENLWVTVKSFSSYFSWPFFVQRHCATTAENPGNIHPCILRSTSKIIFEFRRKCFEICVPLFLVGAITDLCNHMQTSGISIYWSSSVTNFKLLNVVHRGT